MAAPAQNRNFVDVPFSFTVNGVEKGKQKTDDHTVVDLVPVELVEISSDQAPVVLRVGDVEYRAYDGRLIRKMQRPWVDYPKHVDNGTDAMDIKAFAKEVSRFVDGMDRQIGRGWDDYPLPMMRPKGRHIIDGFIAGERNIPFRSVNTSDRDTSVTSAIVKARQSILVVDGVIHVEVPEPIWVIKVEWHALDNPRTFIMCQERPEDAERFHLPFRMGDRDVALEFARDLSGREAVPLRDYDRTEVIGEFDWKYPALEFAVRGQAENLVQLVFDFAQQSLWMHPSFSAAFSTLRDLDRQSASPAEICQAMSQLQEAAELSINEKCSLLREIILERAKSTLLRSSCKDAVSDDPALHVPFGAI